MKVLVDDLTAEQLDDIVAARRAAPAVVAPQVLRSLPDAVWGGWRPRATWRRKPKREAPTRMCVRCGIDTTSPELCRDCTDVLADEAAA